MSCCERELDLVCSVFGAENHEHNINNKRTSSPTINPNTSPVLSDGRAKAFERSESFASAEDLATEGEGEQGIIWESVNRG